VFRLKFGLVYAASYYIVQFVVEQFNKNRSIDFQF